MIIVGIIGAEVFWGTQHETLSENLFLVGLAGILTAGIASLVVVRRRKCVGIVGIAAATIAIVWVVISLTGGSHGIVARLTAPDGTEMCVIETPGGETHQTGFYYRRPGQRWGWFYYEHEDSHWWFGHIGMGSDSRHAVLYRVFLPVAYFEIPTESFTIVRSGRTLSPAQGWMPEGWKPEDALKLASSSASPVEVGAPDNNPPREPK